METRDSIGARMKLLRGTTMTQRELAERSGVTLRVIRALEQDERSTRVGNLQAIADALDTGLDYLLGKVRTMPGAPGTGVMAIRRTLTPVDDLVDNVTHEAEPVSQADADRITDYGWGLYWAGRYDQLTEFLPAALPQLRATAHAVDHPRVHEALARGYWLAGCSLVHLGQQEAAWLAIRQALDSASRGDDPLLDAVLRGSVAWQLMEQGRYGEAERVALTAASKIEPAGEVSPQYTSVYGSLFVTAATAAGRRGAGATAAGLLDEADTWSARNGVDRTDYESPFGPAQLVMQRVDVAVVTEEYGDAVQAAKRMPREAGLPLASRARHLTDVALALAHTGRVERARDTLLTVEQMAPHWIRHQALPRQVAAELVRRDRDRPLRDLARRLGVTG